MGVLLLLNLMTGRSDGTIEAGPEVPYSEVIGFIREGDVSTAWIETGPARVIIERKGDDNVFAFIPPGSTDTLVETLDTAGVVTNAIPAKQAGLLTSLVASVFPLLLFLGLLWLIIRRGGLGGLGAMRLGKSKAMPVEVPDVRFSDVAGVEEAVTDLQEVVDFLHNPEKYTRTGAKVPRGFLLVGAPGTGKTLLARAVAGEAGVPFFAITGSDFVEMFVGLGASRVRDLFAKVREQEKAILFIDEIDAVGKARGRGMQTGANDERENTLNQLLVEMDGFSRRGSIVILAATNRADVLDPALLRPGRFDRRIVVPAPDRKGREQLFELYSRSRPFDKDIDWPALAKRTPGLTGAEIEQVLNEAALEAARQDAATIDTRHLESALATSLLGRERKSAVVTERDRNIVAWHEAGHAIAALTLENADDPVQVTIVPRGAAGGVTWMGGSDNAFVTRSQALAKLTVALAGRAAEEMLLDGDFTQGAHGDLESATQLATEMIARYGMGRHLVARSGERLMLDGPVGEQVDAEVSEILTASLENARGLLREHETLLRQVVEALLEYETLRLDDLVALRDSVGLPGVINDPNPARDDTHS
jgi:cell division protease FtsH